MRSLVLVVLAIAGQTLCQAQTYNPADLRDLPLLEQIKIKMADNLMRLPNYTCAQRTVRARRHAPDLRFDPVDTVRLEVALVGGRELFGWPGTNRITEPDLTDLVTGTIGNGNFALLAKSVFLTDAPQFKAVGNTQVDSREAVKFEYRVPREKSAYRLKVPPHQAIVGYHGAFWVDAKTLDLIRLEVYADDIPPDLGLDLASNSMDYARVKIGAEEFLLPQASELDLMDQHGIENRNRTRFQACRQYTGESALSFTEPELKPLPALPEPAVNTALPTEFAASALLETPIDGDSAAVGDPITARLDHDIKLRHKTVVPKGALLTGRIARLERTPDAYLVDLAFTSIDFEGGHAALLDRANHVSIVPVMASRTATGLSYSYNFTQRETPRAHLDHIAVPGHHVKLKIGSRLEFRSRLLKSDR